MQGGRVEPCSRHRTLPVAKIEVEAGPTATKSRTEELGRRICVTNRMVSEFGATLRCKGCLGIGQPHTEEYRARTTPRWRGTWRVRNDSKRTRPRDWSLPGKPWSMCGHRSKQPMCPLQGDVEATPVEHDGVQRDPINCSGAWSSADGNDVEMRQTTGNKRPVMPRRRHGGWPGSVR